MEMKLTIRRVPTVVSNYQEDGAAGCGRNCLGDCCLPGEPPTNPILLFSSSALTAAKSDVVFVSNPGEPLRLILRVTPLDYDTLFCAAFVIPTISERIIPW
jgi:hypothetical protein